MKKLAIILIGIFLLRLPSLFEPAWYGDEGIYLTIGKVIQNGGLLYRDIWDNKTPLLYFIYALNPVLWWAKLAATLFCLGSVVGSYKLSLRLKIPAVTSALLVGMLISLPRFEGTIANAELFFILPIIFGAYLVFTNTKLWLVGLLASLAFLIKVPAIFDFIGLALYVAVTRKNLNDFQVMTLGFLGPVILTVGYFYFNGGLPDFMLAAFSQNAAYVSVGSGTLLQITNPLFVKAAILGLGSLALIIGFYKRLISKELLFLGLWFGCAIFGALISNRPYTHYLIQIMPPAVLLGVYLIVNIKNYVLVLFAFLIVIYSLNNQFKNAFRLNTISYYRNFIDYKTNQKSFVGYVKFFDADALKTASVAQYVNEHTSQNDTIFIWDDASFIYYLADRKPATKFIQAHHLTTVGMENYKLIIDQLEKVKPKYILVSSGGRFKFPTLDTFIKENYVNEDYKFRKNAINQRVYKLKVT